MVIYRKSGISGSATPLRTVGFFICLLSSSIIIFPGFTAVAEEVTDLGKNSTRPCTNRVSLIIDSTEKWNRSLDELRELNNPVSFTEGRQKGKQGIPLAALLQETDNVRAVEVSTCTGKLRRFEAEELKQKQASLYFIITGYRGLKLHNAVGGEKKKKGSKLKGIDRIRLITQPE
jgi:hypothetical protein